MISKGLLFIPGMGQEFLQTNSYISLTLSEPGSGCDRGINTLKRSFLVLSPT